MLCKSSTAWKAPHESEPAPCACWVQAELVPWPGFGSCSRHIQVTEHMLSHAEAPKALLAAGIAFTAHIKEQQLHVCKLHCSLRAAASLHDLVLRGMVCSALVAVTIHKLVVLVEHK